MARATAADRVAEEVTIRLEALATNTAAAILDSLYRPQVADPTSDQALDYWERLLVPGGVFSPEGRDRVVAQIGAPEYRTVATSIARRRTKRLEEAPEPEPLERTVTPAPQEAY